MYQRLLVALVFPLMAAAPHSAVANSGSHDAGKPHPQPASYCIYDIGRLPGMPAGGSSVSPTAINNWNQIVGSIFSPVVGRAQAFIWDRERGMRALGVLPGHDSAGANDINDAGQVVGTSSYYDTGAQLSFIWDRRNGMRALDASLGGNGHGATGINRFGEVAGVSNTDATGFIQHAYFLDKYGDVFDLGTVSAVNPTTWAAAVNDFGTVVGADSGPTFSQAFVWDEHRGLKLFDQPDSTSVVPNAINNRKQVVGAMYPPDRNRPFLWTPGRGLQDLGSLGGREADGGEAYDINQWGTVVGWSQKADGLGKAFVWNQRSGMRNLEDFINPTSPLAAHARLNSALAINDLGSIVIEGYDARDGSISHTFVLVPQFRHGSSRCR